MKIGVLSDAHGNRIFFDRCMQEIGAKADICVYLGDCYGYMREGNYILHELIRHGAKILLGNHEAMLIGKIKCSDEKEKVYGLHYDKLELSESDSIFLSKLESRWEIEIDEETMLFVHGSPYDALNGYVYVDSDYIFQKYCPYDVVFMGHTHYPYIKMGVNTQYINVGSCGLPRDIGNEPSYVIYDTLEKKAEIHRVVITEETIFSMRDTVHPAVYQCLLRRMGK